MNFHAFKTIQRGFAKQAKFSWANKIHKIIQETSQVTQKDVYCLWNIGNTKMIEEIVKNSKSPVCVMHCPSVNVKKTIQKNKKLTSLERFRLIEPEFVKGALSDFKSSLPSPVVPGKVVMLSLRMEIGAFWHVCLQAFLYNYHLFHNPQKPSRIHGIPEWLHMYLLLSHTDMETLQPPTYKNHDSLTKQLLRSLFTHQTVFENNDSEGDKLTLVRFKLNKERLGVGMNEGEVKLKKGDEVGKLEEISGIGENILNVVEKKVYKNIGGLRKSVEKVTDAKVLKGPEESIVKVQEVEKVIVKRGRSEGRAEKVEDRLRVLMLLKHFESRGSGRVVPLFESECMDVGLDLIQKGGFRMTDQLGHLSWKGWLRLVKISKKHRNFEKSNLNTVTRDHRDEMDCLPECYNRPLTASLF